MSTITTKVTTLSHSDALERLRSAIAARSILEFAVFDHAAAAAEAGLSLPGETVVVFGNPAVGTKLMQHDARVGVELPLRVLVRETATGSEYVYADPRALADEFELAEVTQVLDALAGVLDAVTDEAARA
jgi:uncharacterized protein (DUF302 family)